MNTRPDVGELLRSYDPAIPMGTGLSSRAADDLESIVSGRMDGDGGASPATNHRGPARSWSRRGRWLVAVAAVGAGVVALTAWNPGDSAYASWTAYPTGVTSDVDGPAAATCQERWSRPPEMGGVKEAEGLEPVMAETRGDYSLVLGEGANGYESVCISRDLDPGERGGAGGFSVQEQSPVSVAADGIEVTDYTLSSSNAGWRRVDNHSIVTGHVGDEVGAITIVTPQGFDVEASLLNGRFLAWWPWTTTSFPSQDLDVSFTVTLTNGEVLEGLSLADVGYL